MKHLIIANSFDVINPKSDTGIAIAFASHNAGHDVYWSCANDIYLQNNILMVKARKILSCEEGEYPEISQASALDVEYFTNVSIRKDPPFDQNYLDLCWLLSLVEDKVKFINKPSLLLRYHEKMLPLEAYRRGFVDKSVLMDSWLGYESQSDAINFKGPLVQKPWLGYGGRGVELRASKSELELSQDQRIIVQELISEINNLGDRRAFFISGKYVGSFVRFPADGSIKANLAQGGHAKLIDLTIEQKQVCDQVGKFLASIGIDFAGADLIGSKLSEINITAPTGFASLIELGGADLRADYLNLLV